MEGIGKGRTDPRTFHRCLCHLWAFCPQAGVVVSWTLCVFICGWGEDKALFPLGAKGILFVRGLHGASMPASALVLPEVGAL